MTELALYLAGLALLDGLNPIIVGLYILLLLQSAGSVAAIGFVIGVFASSVASSLVFVFGLGALIALFFERHDGALSALTIAVGIACILFGLLVPRVLKKRSPDTKGKDSIIGGIMLGVFAIQTDIITLTPFLAAMQLVMSGGYDVPAMIGMLIWYNVWMILPMAVLVSVRQGKGKRGAQRVEAIGYWIDRNAASLVAALSVVVGTAIVWYGAARLLATYE